MLNKIKLYGELVDICDGNDVFEAVLNSTIDAIRFLMENYQGIESHISQNNYQVYCGETCIGKEELNFSNNNCDIKIIPVISGSGNVGRMIAGVALIGAAVFTGGTSLTFGLSGFAGGAGISAMAGNIGVLMLLTGVAGLLTPVPEVPPEEEDPTKSFSFSGIQQTGRAGVAVPICYGHVLTGSIPISAKITTTDIEA